MGNLSPFALTPFDISVNSHYVDHLQDGWDWALSGKNSLPLFVDSFEFDEMFVGFWVNVNNEPHGLISFRPYTEEEPTSISFGIFIHKDKRSSGLASLLMLSAIKAMQEIRLPMIATVHEDNIRSLCMIRKTTGQHGTHVHERTKNRNAYVFHLGPELCRVGLDNCVDSILEQRVRLSRLCHPGDNRV